MNFKINFSLGIFLGIGIRAIYSDAKFRMPVNAGHIKSERETRTNGPGGGQKQRRHKDVKSAERVEKILAPLRQPQSNSGVASVNFCQRGSQQEGSRFQKAQRMWQELRLQLKL
ncbi:MAG: hypothetical protein R6W72_14170 [Desulfurivibrionaceae bacterium]